MNTIPYQLYNKEIINIIQNEIEYNNSKSFYEFDEIHKDNLVSLAISSFDNDVEIILSKETNFYLSQYLKSYDIDDLFEFKQSSKLDAYNHFSYYFDLLIDEQRREIESNDLIESGFTAYQCNNTGETLWRKTA